MTTFYLNYEKINRCHYGSVEKRNKCFSKQRHGVAGRHPWDINSLRIFSVQRHNHGGFIQLIETAFIYLKLIFFLGGFISRDGRWLDILF